MPTVFTNVKHYMLVYHIIMFLIFILPIINWCWSHTTATYTNLGYQWRILQTQQNCLPVVISFPAHNVCTENQEIFLMVDQWPSTGVMFFPPAKKFIHFCLHTMRMFQSIDKPDALCSSAHVTACICPSCCTFTEWCKQQYAKNKTDFLW